MAAHGARYIGTMCLGLLFTACQTVPQPIEERPDSGSVETEDKVFGPIKSDEPSQTQEGSRAEPPEKDVIDEVSEEELSGQRPDDTDILPPTDSDFKISFSDYLPGWEEADLTDTLTAFSRNCSVWSGRKGEDALMESQSKFGRYSDWQLLCDVLPSGPNDADTAKAFFESYFLPDNLLTDDRLSGLLTGYYEPEIEARRALDEEYSEPIIEKPKDDDLRKQPRADVYRNHVDYNVLAYGRQVDVFFMQVQGSGRIRFADGTVKRAAYGGNNGYDYKSIGSVLIKRGEITREDASKQVIEDWMIEAGSTAARALMNENKRYIYFGLEEVGADEGPKGSLGIPLTAMASLAIDPKQRPYGIPIWLQTTLPQHSGDYEGEPQSLLVVAQDTGSAIKGEARGDLFFGSGQQAGELAGVMKHDVTMTHLLPRHLVLAELGVQK